MMATPEYARAKRTAESSYRRLDQRKAEEQADDPDAVRQAQKARAAARKARGPQPGNESSEEVGPPVEIGGAGAAERTDKDSPTKPDKSLW